MNRLAVVVAHGLVLAAMLIRWMTGDYQVAYLLMLMAYAIVIVARLLRKEPT